MERKLNAQLWLGVIIALAGVVLLFWGMITPPGGHIDSYVLIGFGEVATFSGSLIGVDYHYKFREYETKLKNE